MPWLKMHSHNPGLECVGLQLGPPTTDHNWGHQGWFRASNTNGRSRCGKPGARASPQLLAGHYLGGTWCPSAPSSRGLRHSLIQRSQSPLSEQISGVSRLPDYLNNAKGSSCTCNMADSEWFDELSWYKRPVPLECLSYLLGHNSESLVAGGVWVQTKACCQTGKLFVIGTWGQWPRKMQVTAVHSNLFGRKNEKKYFKQVILLSCGQQYD